MSQQLHRAENVEFCLVCQRRPETNRNVNFLDIYKPLYGGKTIKEYFKDLFNITVHI